MIATWITRQLVFDGAVTGLITGLLAMGVVLVYRSTRVINFAVGNLGLIGASLFAVMVVNYGFPFWIALALTLTVGTLFGAVMELTVIRRLFDAPRVVVLVATVGIAQLAQAIVRAYPDIESARARYPVVMGAKYTPAFDLTVKGSQLAIIVVVPCVAVLLGWLMNRTTFGHAVTASADNPELARLKGVNPKVVSTFVWTIAGLLSTLSIVLLSGQSGTVSGLEDLGPITLSKALVAAVLAGMFSFPRALVAGILLGIVESLVRFNFFSDPGLTDFLIFLLVVAAVYVQARRSPSKDESAFAFSGKVAAIPDALRQLWWVRHLTHIVLAVGAVVAVVLPFIAEKPSRHLTYTVIVCFALCALSITVIAGWSGQMSLAQMTFAGLGAMFAGALNRGVHMNVGWRSVRLLRFDAPGLPFALSIGLAAVVVAGIAALIGAGALRFGGLLLAITTFVFAIAARQYLFRRPLLSDNATSSIPFPRGSVLGVDLSGGRTYYLACLAVLAVVFAVLARLRRTGVGRRTLAVRDNSDTAAAYTVSPAATKMTAFALAGGIAALGGGLLAGAIENVPVDGRFFSVGDSLALVGLAVIGGVGSLVGPLLGALWIEGLPAFFDNELVPLFTSSLGLLIILMYFPGGFAQIGFSARNALLRVAARRLDPPAAVKTISDVPTSLRRTANVATPEMTLRAADLVVRFGGNVAVDGASIDVRRDEIVGLIGTNGAGKSTLMNAIGGFVSSDGTVEIMGRNATNASAAGRARLGLGRTFQAAMLFPELTVRETVQVALEARGRTPLVASALFLPPSGRIERTKRAEADELIDFLGLGRYADAFVSDLSTGTRRIVEVACLLALDAKVLCLDEPTAGVAQRETEAFGPLLVAIRAEMNASMLVIEHDMPLIMSMSDRVYCLEAGRVIAHGTPEAVRNDSAVIASYLGTDDRAIRRSDAGVRPDAG